MTRPRNFNHRLFQWSHRVGFGLIALTNLPNVGAQNFNPPQYIPPPPQFALPSQATDKRLDADGVPMAIGVDLYGSSSSLAPGGMAPVGQTPSRTAAATAGGQAQTQRFADVRFDADINGSSSIPNNSPKANYEERIFKSGRLLAVVGTEPILEGDIRPMVDPLLHKNGVPRDRWDDYRERLIRPALREQITNKALALRFTRDIVGTKPPKELIEARKKIEPRITQSFFEKMVPKLMADYEAATELELDEKLREGGASLASQQAGFRDSILAQQAIEKGVPKKKNITLSDLREYYEKHNDEWNKPARAKWKQLSVRFKNHPNKQIAHETIANMGNDIVYGGVSFEVIAKKKSEGFTADKGGHHDWTTQGALKSTAIDAALFKLEMNRLSEIIEDEEGFHIIVVLDREAARKQPMEEVQLEMRDKIQAEHRSGALKEFAEKVRKETNIWTLWPEDIPGSKPLSDLSPE